MQTASYYKSSGVIPPLAPILLLTVGLGATWLLALGYAYATAYIPFVYISFLLTLAFGAGVGMIINFCGLMGKARNPGFMLISGLLISLFGLYACWSIWFKAKGAGTGFFIPPGALLDIIGRLSEEGAWTVSDFTPTGGVLYAVWGIEALVIVGFAMYLVKSSANDTPFCEECNQWADDEKMIGPLAPVMNGPSFRLDVEQGNIHAVMDLPLIEDRYAQYTIVKLLSCPDCERSSLFLTVTGVTIEVDDDGDESKDETDIIKNLIISREEYDQLANHHYMPKAEDNDDVSEE